MSGRTFGITFNQLLNLARTMELRPLIDTLRARWVGLDPTCGDETIIGTVTTRVGERGEVSIHFDGKPVHAEIVTEPKDLRLTIDPPTPRLEYPTPAEVRAATPETSAPVIGWACYEVIADSPAEAAVNNRLNDAAQHSTEEADTVRQTQTWTKHLETGYTSIPVLECLVGRPWDARALNMLEAVRPSAVQVVGERSIRRGDCVKWRVTVTLAADDRTIAAVEQEVEVGLRGWRYGLDASAYADGRTPQR